MVYYNANEVIKLTRKAMGLTQEELSEGICEVVTLSRIENGHTSVKRSTYKKLMEKRLFLRMCRHEFLSLLITASPLSCPLYIGLPER